MRSQAGRPSSFRCNSSINCRIVLCCSSSFLQFSAIAPFSARISVTSRSSLVGGGLRSLCARGTREQRQGRQCYRSLTIYRIRWRIHMDCFFLEQAET